MAILAMVVSGLLLVAIPAGTSVWAISRSKAALATEVTEGQEAAARTTASQIEQGFGFAMALAKSAAHRPGLVLWTEQRNADQQRAVLQNVYSTTPLFGALAVFDPDGRLLVQFPSALASPLSEVASASSPRIFPARPAGEDAIVAVREPMNAEGGPTVGFLVAEISLSKAAPDFLSFRFGETGTATLVDDQGRVLLSGAPERRGKSLTAPEVLRLIQGSRQGEATYQSQLLRRREIAFYAPLPRQPWGVLITTAESEELGHAAHLSRVLWVGVASSIVLGAIIAALGALIISRLLRRLGRERNRLTAILDNTAAVVYLKDLNGRYALINRGFEALFHVTREQVLGKTAHDLFPEEIADVFWANDKKALEAEGPVEFEEVATQDDGPRTFVSVKFPLHDPDGRAYAICGIATDITERKRAEEAAHRAKDEAERTNQAKSEFLSRMSHELRTPLNAILGFAQLLEMDHLDAGQIEGVQQILKGGKHLLDLINEVLDISRIEAGRLSLSPEPIRVTEVLGEALDLVRPIAAERSVRLEGAVPEAGHFHVLADRQRLKQVLLNLLANAVKYNREGGSVWVFCEEASEASKDLLRISVKDTGRGIRPEDIERLFAPFDRLGAEQTGVQGTGLGLALSKRLIEAMGGTVDVESAPGEGSTFSIELPLVEPPVVQFERMGEVDPAPASVLGEAATLLYVEDNLSNLRLIERILANRPQVKLLSAMQGRLGLDLARQHRPDLILLDLHLPDMSGEEVLHQLREDPRTRAIAVVVISADATPGQVSRLIDAGALAYLTKPLDVRRFLEVIDATLRERVQ
jgi:PAS domain S-box-containing protein